MVYGEKNDFTQYRTHTCNDLKMEHCGQEVVLSGWYSNLRRVSKSLGFLLLRDFYGVTQIVIETEAMMEALSGIHYESVLQVKGTVRERSNKNCMLDTGEIEVLPSDLKVLSKCRYNALPFDIEHSREADEKLRLKYRYLDLRNKNVKDNIILKTRVVKEIRKIMENMGFMEINTPILTCSSPEGARDYLVPSRNHAGKFYALPQAPQQFKQILMASGFDKYFQIAPCFRDEDARADRSPGEFYQLDMEMAFASQEDVFNVLEEALPQLFEKYGKYETKSKCPFMRMPYKEALEHYGTDKPDLRIDLLVKDATEILRNCDFEPLNGNTIKVVITDGYHVSRKEIDKLCAEAEVESGNKVYWTRINEAGDFVGGIAKFLANYKEDLFKIFNLKPGDFIAFTAGTEQMALKAAGVVRRLLGKASEGHFVENQYAFCWIVDFPMYEIGEESGVLEFCHNPFSMPQGGMEALRMKEPLEILAYQYDLVCNGVELSSGAVRNHDPEIMIEAFKLVGLTEEDVKSNFPAVYHAFCYGAPPHAGIAPGIERIVMLLSGENNIREVIPFPMNKNAEDIMMGAPSKVSQKQLDDVHIQVKAPYKEKEK